MSATILSGTETAAVVRGEVADRVATLGKAGKQVGLATILVGDDAPSQIYVRNKHRAAQKAGMISIDRHLPETASQTDIESVIAELNADDQVDGIILQLPLPDGLDAEGAVETIQPTKDADGLHPFNLGLLVMGRPGP